MSAPAAIEGHAGRRRESQVLPRLRSTMIRLWGSPRLAACLFLGAALALRVVDPQPLETLRLYGFDLLQTSQPRQMVADHVAIVDIDERSLAQIGQWPWPRTQIADLIERLNGARAQAIGFDMLFAEPDRLSPARFAALARGLEPDLLNAVAAGKDHDVALAETMADIPVVLGVSATHERDHPYADRRFKVTPIVEQNGDPRPFVLSYGAVIRNLGSLEEAAAGRGMVTLNSERDGLVRRVPAVLRVGRDLYPTLAVELARIALDRPHYRVSMAPNGGGLSGIHLGQLELPTDLHGLVWLRHGEHDPSLYLSAADLLEGSFDQEAVRDKIILVGTSAVGLRDLRATPVSASIPGVEIHAQLLDAILSQEFLTRPSYSTGLELALTLVLGAVVILVLPMATALTSLPIIGALLTGVAGGTWYLFDAHAILLDASYPILTCSALFSWLIYSNYSRAEVQRRQVRAAFSQYLAPALVERLTKDPEQLELGGEQREMTFLFTDIAGFTSFAEGMSPTTLVTVLNTYLDNVCRIVMEQGGTIDKIVGDAIHAIFNAPIDQPDHACRAVVCGLAIDRFGKEFAASMHAGGHDFGLTRIGINTGSCVVGNFGGSHRFDYTAHGDAINTAARLESVNKHLGTTICVAGSTTRQCPSLHFRPVGNLYLKGKTEGLEAFEALDEDEAASERVRDYRAAFQLLETESPEGRDAFERLAESHADDALVAFHQQRLAAGQSGVDIVMDKK